MNKEKIIQSAIGAFLAATVSQSTWAGAEPDAAPVSEKCYGITKAGMNDCATATSSCAGSSTQDKQADAFILLPPGICERLVGGQLKPATPPASNSNKE